MVDQPDCKIDKTNNTTGWMMWTYSCDPCQTSCLLVTTSTTLRYYIKLRCVLLLREMWNAMVRYTKCLYGYSHSFWLTQDGYTTQCRIKKMLGGAISITKSPSDEIMAVIETFVAKCKGTQLLVKAIAIYEHMQYFKTSIILCSFGIIPCV